MLPVSAMLRASGHLLEAKSVLLVLILFNCFSGPSGHCQGLGDSFGRPSGGKCLLVIEKNGALVCWIPKNAGIPSCWLAGTQGPGCSCNWKKRREKKGGGGFESSFSAWFQEARLGISERGSSWENQKKKKKKKKNHNGKARERTVSSNEKPTKAM